MIRVCVSTKRTTTNPAQHTHTHTLSWALHDFRYERLFRVKLEMRASAISFCSTCGLSQLFLLRFAIMCSDTLKHTVSSQRVQFPQPVECRSIFKQVERTRSGFVLIAMFFKSFSFRNQFVFTHRQLPSPSISRNFTIAITLFSREMLNCNGQSLSLEIIKQSSRNWLSEMEFHPSGENTMRRIALLPTGRKSRPEIVKAS